jgi:hypothetical protein
MLSTEYHTVITTITYESLAHFSRPLNYHPSDSWLLAEGSLPQGRVERGFLCLHECLPCDLCFRTCKAARTSRAFVKLHSNKATLKQQSDSGSFSQLAKRSLGKYPVRKFSRLFSQFIYCSEVHLVRNHQTYLLAFDLASDDLLEPFPQI